MKVIIEEKDELEAYILYGKILNLLEKESKGKIEKRSVEIVD